MDDLELEARLRTRLHRRFDGVTPPPELLSNVRQSMATEPRSIGFTMRARKVQLGWAAIAAAAVIVVAAVGLGRGFGISGPGAAPTVSPTATATPERDFVVLPPSGSTSSKPEAILASDVLSARLRALGVSNFSSGGGYAITFSLPAGGPSDAAIRAVLGATGDVQFIPLPVTDYGEGKLTATVGAPLPKNEPALFGWDGVMTVAQGANQQGLPELDVTLRAAAAQAVSDYTTAHIGETLAIVVDGRVAMVPFIQSPITGGQIAIAFGQLPTGSQELDPETQAAAVLLGGELPEAWRGATSPVLISRAMAEAAALTATPGATIQDATSSIELPTEGAELQVVWNVEVVVPPCSDLGSCAWSPGPYVVKVDAITGKVVHVGPVG